MTKSMLEKCLNPEMRAFCALDEDVQKAFIGEGAFTESLGYDRVWHACHGHPQYHNKVYRLSPDTPTEPEYEEKTVELFDEKWLGVNPTDDTRQYWLLCVCVCHKRFIGIIYTLNGVETMRTSVDAAFGTPIRVRFVKGE